jgi:hypothetical protein
MVSLVSNENQRKLTDEEMLELQNRISKGVEHFFDNYDWDEDFQKNIGNKPNPE